MNPARTGVPARLAELAEPPRRLFVRGTIAPERRWIAIVGARAASGHGMAAARDLAAELVTAGFGIVSGGAIGIDAAAHRGALSAGGDTLAVLAGGLDSPYPARNRPLFRDIVAGGGALVSPYEPGTPPRRWQFVRRNQLIAGIADAVIVVEAGLASGALYTAAAAGEYGRPLGAYPGTHGCEALIAQGAAVVERADDLMNALAGTPRRPVVELPLGGSDECVVLEALACADAFSEADLVTRTGLGARRVTRALTGLELEGLAVLLPGRAFVRSSLAEELLTQ